ncbi:MAG: glycosyltransferase [Acidimicrobiia bacterium]|nr:glycosyltransferase [Acidimicrobiia bacterium]
MRVLVLTNMLPSPDHPHFGIFVARRIASYRSLGVEVDVVANTDRTKGTARVIAKYVRLLVGAVAVSVRRRPNIIEAHYLYPTAIVAAVVGLLARRPIVLVAHGSDVDLDHHGVVATVMKWAVRRSSRVVANSPATAATVLSTYPGSDVVVIPPGVVTSAAVDKHLTGPPVVGFVGSLADHKGPDVLLEALPLLPDDCRVRIVGEGPLGDSLEQRAANLEVADRVEFIDRVPPGELSSFYRAIDVLAVPSRREGFGLVAAEALASGTPVVVSDVGGLPTIPTDDCGTVVPPDDPPKLAVAISAWLERRGDESVSKACRRRASEFDELVLARQAFAVLESVTK